MLVLALYGLAIYLARGARRKTLAHVGWALVIVGLLILIARRLIGNYVISSLVDETYRKPATTRLADRDLDPRLDRLGDRHVRADPGPRRAARRPVAGRGRAAA